MIVNAAEHAWVLGDDRFPLDKEVAVCPNHFPEREQSGHDLLASMQDHGVDRTVISHVCYYGRNNDYTPTVCRPGPIDSPEWDCWWAPGCFLHTMASKTQSDWKNSQPKMVSPVCA